MKPASKSAEHKWLMMTQALALTPESTPIINTRCEHDEQNNSLTLLLLSKIRENLS